MGAAPDLVAFYSEGAFERDRLRRGRGRLELARTQELLRRALPNPPAALADVGGGPGTHASWLARTGYQVSLLDALRARRLDDALLAEMSAGVLADGRMEAGETFPAAFCHTPDQLRDEVASAGFHVTGIHAVEGAGWLLYDKDPSRREGDHDEADGDDALLGAALRAARATEDEPALLGVSAHLLAVARAPGRR